MSVEITVSKVIEKLPSRFQADAAKDLDAVYQFYLEDGEDFFIQIKDQTCTTFTGENSDPTISLFMNTDTFIRVVTGEQDGMSSFFKGQLRAEGNVMLATKLG